jgi:hypothetical protein
MSEQIADIITGFLNDVGLESRSGKLNVATFVPGIAIVHGVIVFDPSEMIYPGDLLHEAGHLAVMPIRRRRLAHLSVGKRAAEELMAIAWSWAAAVRLALEPSVVFHEGGYKGGSASLIENFEQRRFIGVPMLQWLGMTADARNATELGIEPFPHMIKWINDTNRGVVASARGPNPVLA